MRESNKRASWWDSGVEKVCKDIGRNQYDILSIEKYAGFKTEVKERI